MPLENFDQDDVNNQCGFFSIIMMNLLTKLCNNIAKDTYITILEFIEHLLIVCWVPTTQLIINWIAMFENLFNEVMMIFQTKAAS